MPESNDRGKAAKSGEQRDDLRSQTGARDTTLASVASPRASRSGYYEPIVMLDMGRES